MRYLNRGVVNEFLVINERKIQMEAKFVLLAWLLPALLQPSPSCVAGSSCHGVQRKRLQWICRELGPLGPWGSRSGMSQGRWSHFGCQADDVDWLGWSTSGNLHPFAFSSFSWKACDVPFQKGFSSPCSCLQTLPIWKSELAFKSCLRIFWWTFLPLFPLYYPHYPTAIVEGNLHLIHIPCLWPF